MTDDDIFKRTLQASPLTLTPRSSRKTVDALESLEHRHVTSARRDRVDLRDPDRASQWHRALLVRGAVACDMPSTPDSSAPAYHVSVRFKGQTILVPTEQA
jgi:hypothetical protein